MNEPGERSHRAGETTGSSERAPQELTGARLVFDLRAEAAQVRLERGYREGERNANTLVKTPQLRVVLTALRAGSRLHEHRAPGWVSVQTVEGHLRLQVAGETVDLPAGALVTLEPDLAHDVEALEDSVFLLTIAWPAGVGAG